MRALEAGANGVMVSMVHSPEEVERAVRWAKFHPRGERGMNGGNRDGKFGLTPMAEYVKQANERTFIGIQVETAGALASVGEIARVPDVDLVFVGPADISQVMGVPGDFENSQVPGCDRGDSPAPCARAEQAMGRRPPRAGVREADGGLGLHDVRPRLRHPCLPRGNPGVEGAVFGLLSSETGPTRSATIQGGPSRPIPEAT